MRSVTAISSTKSHPQVILKAKRPPLFIRANTRRTRTLSSQIGNNWTYGYDSRDRLIAADNDNGSVDDRAYAYDDVDNMIYNSGLCAGSAAAPNLLYPTAGSPRPHGPKSICGATNVVTYDANGNTLSYDVDGAGPKLLRTLSYDGENRPVSILRNGSTTSMAYGPDGERVSKLQGSVTTHYFGGDAEFSSATNLATSYLHPDVRREGAATDILIKDHLASNRVTLRFGGATTPQAYSPYGSPKNPNLSGRGYINERYDPETELQYLHARYRDPDLPNFLTPDWWDVIQPGVDVNRYTYAGDDPVNGSDAEGHTWMDDVYYRFAYPNPEERDDFLEKIADMREMDGQDSEDSGNPDVADEAFSQAEYLRDSKGKTDKQLAVTVTIGVAMDLVSGGKGKAFRPSVQIFGKAQKAGPGHAFASARAALSYLTSPVGKSAKSLFFNKSMATITGGLAKSRMRPDVAIALKNGKIFMIEIRSGKQKISALEAKLERMQKMLPESKRGGSLVLEKNNIKSRR
jgi:RHS repeat-associated protein